MLKILLVTEHSDKLEALEQDIDSASQSMEVEVISALSYEKGLELHRLFAYELIVLPIDQQTNLSHIFNFCKNFNLQNTHHYSSLIALFDYQLEEEKKEAVLNEAVDFFLTSPLDPFSLRSLLQFCSKKIYSTQNENMAMEKIEILTKELENVKKNQEHMYLKSKALQSVVNGVVITNKNGVILWVNGAFCDMTGYLPNELIGETLQILKSGKQDHEFYAQLWQTITSGQVWKGEFINRKKNRELYHEESTITPIFDEEGKIEYFVGFKQDITDRKAYEAALRESEQKLKALFSSTENGFILLNNDYEVVFYNHKAQELSASIFTEKIDYGKAIYDILPEREQMEFKHHLVLAYHGEKTVFDKQFKIGEKDYWFELTFTPIEKSGNVSQVVIQYYDITERVFARQKADEQYAFLDTLIDTIPNPIYYKDVSGIYMGSNKAFADFLGLAKSEIIGKSVFDVAPYDLAKMYHKNDKSLIQTPGIHIYEGQAQNFRGEMKTFVFYKATFFDTHKKVAGLIGVMLDVSEMKQMQQEMITAKEKYEELINNLEVGIYRSIPEKGGQIIEANPAMFKILGIDQKDELKEIAMEGLYFEKFQHMEFLRLMKEKGIVRDYELLLQNKKNNLFWASITAVAKKDSQGKIYFDGIMEDISERKDSEKKIKHRMHLERIISDISTSFVNNTDFEQTIQLSLIRIGEFSNADRVYIFEFDQEREFVYNTYVWGASGVQIQAEGIQKLPSALFPWWMKQLNTNQIIWLNSIDDLPPDAQAERDILTQRNVLCAIALPIFVNNEIIGFLKFDSITHTMNWAEDDRELLRVFSQIIGNAYQQRYNQIKLKKYTKQIENDLGEKLQSLKKAQVIQQDLNTDILPVQPKVDIGAFYMPLESLGGDYFDIRELAMGKIALVMADCTGHGIEAALYSVIVKSLADRFFPLLEEDHTDQFLFEINNAMIEYFQGYNFLTMFVGILDANKRLFTYSNANAETPFLIKKEEIIKVPPAKGFYIGYTKNQPYVKQSITIQDQDRFFFYSDALKEIRMYNSCFGTEGIRELLEIIQAEQKELSAFIDKIEIINQNFPFDDDLTTVLLEYREPFFLKTEIKSISEARDLRHEIQNILEKYNYDEFDTQSLIVAFDEMSSNGIIHGNKLDPNKKLKVDININFHFSSLIIEDEGDGFIPDKLPDPTDIERLKELIAEEKESIYTHGRGVYLTKKIVDLVQFNKKGNNVRVIKYRKASKTRFIFSQ